MSNNRGTTRRQFLGRTACAAVGMTALGHTIFDLQRIAAAATLADSKSLVCIFLYGGNDGNNVVVPTGAGDYAQYASTRSGLALPQSSLLSLNLLSATPGDSRQWGLHPSLKGIQGLFNAGRTAPVVNVRPLLPPHTRDEYLNHHAPVPQHQF